MPNQGYLREEIEKIAQELDLGTWTSQNLLSLGIKRNYLFLKKDTNRYYRSDSDINNINFDSLDTVDINGQERQDFSVQYSTSDLKLDKASRFWKTLQNAKQKKQIIFQEKQKLEQEEKNLNEEISELERNLAELLN